MMIAVALQAILGNDSRIYRKWVRMPILPICTSVQLQDNIDTHIHAYWYSEAGVICWLSSWRHIQDEYKRTQEDGWTFPSNLSLCFQKYFIDNKPHFLEAGFVMTQSRAARFRAWDILSDGCPPPTNSASSYRSSASSNEPNA